MLNVVCSKLSYTENISSHIHIPDLCEIYNYFISHLNQIFFMSEMKCEIVHRNSILITKKGSYVLTISILYSISYYIAFTPLQKFHMNMFQNRMSSHVNTCDYMCDHMWLHVITCDFGTCSCGIFVRVYYIAFWWGKSACAQRCHA